jgi:predicted amidohydrolase YtcJ
VDTTPRLEGMFFGGSIYADESMKTRTEALGIRQGRIEALGSRRELEGMCDERTVVRDLKGGCLLPGFIDPHNHFTVRSLSPLMTDCRTPPVQTLKEILGRMQQHAEAVDPGGWVVGWGYEEMLLKRGRHPTRKELDDACPRNPAVLMHLTLHQCVANSLALEYCGIDRYTRNPPGGRIGRDLRGIPNGLLLERAAMGVFDAARNDLVSQAGTKIGRFYRENADRLLRFGVVRAADAAMRPQDLLLWEAHGAGQEIPLVLDRMEVGSEGMMDPPEHLLSCSPEGRVPVVKLFMDGAGQCAMELTPRDLAHGVWDLVREVRKGRSAWGGLKNLRSTEVRVGRSGTVRLGFFLNDPEKIESVVAEAHRMGYPVATHALGNAAVRRILEIYQRVQERYGPPERPFRVEHALFLTRELIEKMARWNVAAVVQPAFVYQYGSLLASLPLAGSVKILPLRTLIDAGVLVSGSSDGPCAHEDPLLAMDCALRRMTADGKTLDEGEAIRAEESILLYTRNAARVMGCGHENGSLEKGKRADMVILSGDPLLRGFDRIRVIETVVAGATVWKRGVGQGSGPGNAAGHRGRPGIQGSA